MSINVIGRSGLTLRQISAILKNVYLNYLSDMPPGYTPKLKLPPLIVSYDEHVQLDPANISAIGYTGDFKLAKGEYIVGVLAFNRHVVSFTLVGSGNGSLKIDVHDTDRINECDNYEKYFDKIVASRECHGYCDMKPLENRSIACERAILGPSFKKITKVDSDLQEALRERFEGSYTEDGNNVIGAESFDCGIQVVCSIEYNINNEIYRYLHNNQDMDIRKLADQLGIIAISDTEEGEVALLEYNSDTLRRRYNKEYFTSMLDIYSKGPHSKCLPWQFDEEGALGIIDNISDEGVSRLFVNAKFADLDQVHSAVQRSLVI